MGGAIFEFQGVVKAQLGIQEEVKDGNAELEETFSHRYSDRWSDAPQELNQTETSIRIAGRRQKKGG